MIRKIWLAIIMSLFFLSATVDADTIEKKIIPNTTAYADREVVDAFISLGFKVKYDKKLEFAGIYSTKRKLIILKKKNRMYTLHEMGHFLAVLHGGADKTKKFKNIFRLEKRKYEGQMKDYIRKNSKEYFAQSFYDYTMAPGKLKEKRPKTYLYILKKVEACSEATTEEMRRRYCWE